MGDIQIVAGLDFFQTEPRLLEMWLKKSHQSERFNCKIVTKGSGSGSVFHPKVLIVQGAGTAFAIVGSGNLSSGGFGKNIECSLLSEDPVIISSLLRWFDHVYEHLATPLDEPTIQRYKPLYEKYNSRNRKLASKQAKELAEVDNQREASLRRWRAAVEEARRFFADPAFIRHWRQCDEAAMRIRECLNYPGFDFDYGNWQDFLRIPQFGNLRALNLYRRKLIPQMGRLRAAFRIITDDSKDIRWRLSAVLSGNAKVVGIDLNVVTKILTVHNRKHWPVFNSKVRGVLRSYGYVVPRGLSKADKYLAYSRLMQQFVKETKARDMYAVDRFFLDRAGH